MIPDVLALLSSAPGGTSSKTVKSFVQVNPTSRFGSAKSRFAILESLNAFLGVVFAVENSDPYVLVNHSSDWYLEKNRLLAAKVKLKNKVEARSNYISCLNNMKSGFNHQNDRESVIMLVSQLVPILMDLWVECLPDAIISVHKISVNKPLTICRVVLELLSLLWSALEKYGELESVSAQRQVLVDSTASHILVHFPFGKGYTIARDSDNAAEKMLTKMNISVSGLISQFSDAFVSASCKTRMNEFLEGLFAVKKVKAILLNSVGIQTHSL